MQNSTCPGKRAIQYLLLLLLVFVGSCIVYQKASEQNGTDVNLVRAAVVRTGIAFSKGEVDTLLSYYAKDIVVSFPDIPDTYYSDFEKGFQNIRSRPAGIHVATRDSIEEILVSGDLAMVRVTWITTTTNDSTQKSSTRRSRDLQIWRREADGKWKFARGMWYRLKS